MLNFLRKIIGWSRETVTAPVEKRRRIATFAVVASLPFVVFLWWFSTRFYGDEHANLGAAMQAMPLGEGRQIIEEIQRGFMNLQLMVGELSGLIQNYQEVQTEEPQP